MDASDFIGIDRQCKKCLAVKDLSSFYRHPTCKLGHLYTCVQCHKKDGSIRQRRPESKKRKAAWFSRKWVSGEAFRARLARNGKAYFAREDVKKLMADRIREWRKLNPEEAKAAQKRANESARKKPHYRCHARISQGVRNSLRGTKAQKTFDALDYSCQELIAHIERQFVDGMSWENMGKWHIDHIVPVSSFVFESEHCLEFKRAWALTNLRPLWAQENQIKHAKRVFLI